MNCEKDGRGPITKKEIERLKQRIRIGDVFSTVIVYDETGERLAVPVLVLERLTGKYRHLITLECPGKRGYVKKRSVTYVEFLMDERKGEKHV